MASDSKSGSDFNWIIIVLIVMFALWLGRSETQELVDSASPIIPMSGNRESNSSSSDNGEETIIQNSNQSKYQNLVSLELGNARSATEANREYVVISANRRNDDPVNISGWTLKNDSNKIGYNYEGKAIKRRVLKLKLPSQGILMFNPYSKKLGAKKPIILNPGERAIVISGGVPSIGLAVINDSFAVNKCFGYVQDQTSYAFTPSFDNRCPRDNDLPESDYLSQNCLSYINRRPSCHKPEFKDDSNYGTCVDRNCNLDSQCLAFIKKNYSYESCFNRHSRDEDFLVGEWRLFLNQVWELWPNKDETIYLYDPTGKLVDQLDY
mgnify:CR=1 FL=1